MIGIDFISFCFMSETMSVWKSQGTFRISWRYVLCREGSFAERIAFVALGFRSSASLEDVRKKASDLEDRLPAVTNLEEEVTRFALRVHA